MKAYDLAMTIGRWEPAHNGHKRNLIETAKQSDKVLIIIGSAFQPRTIKNPINHEERKAILKEIVAECVCSGEISEDVEFHYEFVRDYKYEENRWLCEIQEAVSKRTQGIERPKVCILGHDKDLSTYYLNKFPYVKYELGSYSEIGETPINATAIRELLFERNYTMIKGVVPDATYKFLKEFIKTEEFEALVEEYNYIKNYKKAWEAAPFPPTFNTVDAVVVQGGYILLGKRKNAPGKGLWALPGGFIDPNETTRDAILRELDEETEIKVARNVLDRTIKNVRTFDHPDRSLRGRTITQAFLFELNAVDGKLPKVKGADDIEEARWFTLAEVKDMSPVLFEDHHSIISIMTTRLS